MSDHIKPENSAEHESFEHQDLKAAGIVYFLLTLGVVTMLCMFGLRGLYAYLDKREKASQPAVSPLVTSVPEDTRHVAPGYPQTAFPSPSWRKTSAAAERNTVTTRRHSLQLRLDG